jgi:hypothetical protein
MSFIGYINNAMMKFQIFLLYCVRINLCNNGAEHQLDHQSVCKEHGHRIIIKHLNDKDSV